MECREAQLLLLARPGTDEPVLQSHVAQCDACRRAAQSVAQLDREIEGAATSIVAPEGLSARVLLRQGRTCARRVKATLQALLARS